MMLQTLIFAILATSAEAVGFKTVSHLKVDKSASFAQLAKKYERKDNGLMNADLASKEYMEAHGLPQASVITSAGRAGAGSVTKWLNDIGVPAVHRGTAPGAVALGWHYAVPRDNINAIRSLPPKADRRLTSFIEDMHKADQSTAHLVEKFPEKAEKQQYQALKKPIMFTNTVHLVRDPLDHIQSLAAEWDTDSDNYKWAEQFVGDLGQTRLEHAANYWLKWNQMAGKKATETFRVEHLKENSLIEALGVQDKVKQWPLPRFNKMEKVDVTPADKKGEKLTWATLEQKVGRELTQKIKTQAEKYGYKY